MRILKWTALGAWLLLAVFALIVVAASTVAGRVGDVQTNDLRNWLPATADSTRAIDIAQTRFTSGEPENLLIVYARDSGITGQDRAAVAADSAALGGGQAPPSRDGKALLLLVPLTPDQLDEGTLPGVLDRVTKVVNDGLPDGLQTRLTGGPAAAADFDAAFDSLDVTVLAVTAGVVALLLLLTYRSPVLLLLPLIAVAAASRLANALVYLCAKHFGLVVDGASAGILTVLVFGAGTDYALLIISRYREELGRHENRYEAMRLALRQSLPPIAASAATVILALLTLTFAEMNSTRGLGPVAAIGIASAFVAMTTFLPAMLVLAGRWAFWPFAMRPSRVSWGFAARHPRPVWMATAVGLAALALVATGLTTAQSREDTFVTKPDSVAGFELLAAHYPAGASAPAMVYTPTGDVPAVSRALQQVPGVASVGQAEAGGAGWSRLPVTLADDPSGADARRTVARMRQAAPAAVIGGETAEKLDQDAAMDADLRLILPLILLVVLAVLIVLLRSLLAPLLLLASVVLSFGAALGASLLIFRALGFPNVEKTVLLNGFLFLVALGVDYTIFLMSRAREEVAAVGHREGVTRALAVTAGVITSAGVVLAATFSVLGLMPIVFMMQLGILVAVGVLLDTFVVRTLLVPGLALHIGPRVWWPHRVGTGMPD